MNPISRYVPLESYRSNYQQTHADRMEQALADARAEAMGNADAAAQQVKLYQSLIDGELRNQVILLKADAAATSSAATLVQVGKLAAAVENIRQRDDRLVNDRTRLQLDKQKITADAFEIPSAVTAGGEKLAETVARSRAAYGDAPLVGGMTHTQAYFDASPDALKAIDGLDPVRKAGAVAGLRDSLVAQGIPEGEVQDALTKQFPGTAVVSGPEYRVARDAAIAGEPLPGAGGGGTGLLTDVRTLVAREVQALLDKQEGGGEAPAPRRQPQEYLDSQARVEEYRAALLSAAEGSRAALDPAAIYRRAGEYYAPVAREPEKMRPNAKGAAAVAIAAREFARIRAGQGLTGPYAAAGGEPPTRLESVTARALGKANQLVTSGAVRTPPPEDAGLIASITQGVVDGTTKASTVYTNLMDADLVGGDPKRAESILAYVLANLKTGDTPFRIPNAYGFGGEPDTDPPSGGGY